MSIPDHNYPRFINDQSSKELSRELIFCIYYNNEIKSFRWTQRPLCDLISQKIRLLVCINPFHKAWHVNADATALWNIVYNNNTAYGDDGLNEFAEVKRNVPGRSVNAVMALMEAGNYSKLLPQMYAFSAALWKKATM